MSEGGKQAASEGARRAVDLAHVRPYADRLDDGLMQLSFTLPVPYGKSARRAAIALAAKMGLEHPEVVHFEPLTEGYVAACLARFSEGPIAVALDGAPATGRPALRNPISDGMATYVRIAPKTAPTLIFLPPR